MNVALIIFIIEIGTAFTHTEALPNWNWSGKNKWWSYHHSDAHHSCETGHCVKVWNCPKAAIVAESKKDNCLYWDNGPWVCCLTNDDDSSNHHWGDSDFYTSAAPNNFKHTTIKPLKRSTTTVTEKHKYDSTHKPLLKDSWDRNTQDGHSYINPLGDILKNDREKYPFYRSKNKTGESKFPHISITNVITDNKSTSNIDYKRTSNPKDKTLTSTLSPNYYKRTTNSWNKLPTSTSNTKYHKRTTNTQDKFSTSTLSSNYYKRTSNAWDKPRISTSSTNYYKRTTNSWEKPHTSDSRIIFPNEKVTKYTTTTSPTKRISNNVSTKKLWTQSTPTKPSWGHSTAYIRTTKHAYSKNPTHSINVSTQRRNQIWKSSTATNPSRSQTTKTTRSSSTRSTAKSTRRYSVTTPLPNLNIYLCGLRNERTLSRRQSRDDNNGRNPVVHSGNTRSRSRVPYERIVGGEEVEPFSWPWVAALYKVTSSGGNRLLSAGSLINENFILTAAHVFTPDDLRTASYVVMLGTHDAQDAVAQYVVSSVLLHPSYEHRYYYNDIALLKLERKVTFNDYIMPICLPSPSAPLHADKDLIGKNVTVMGWGDESFGGKSSQVLKEASFPIVSRVSCNASYLRVASNRFPKGITANMLCAGDPKGGKDACQGDSGGPLTVIENGRHTQVGIVSFGYKCGDKEYPGVYTKVAPYLTWIAENTKHVDGSTDYEYY